MDKPIKLLAISLAIAGPSAGAVLTVLRADDSQSGLTSSTAGLADSPVDRVPPIGDKDNQWGFAANTANNQSQLGLGTEAARLANYVWGSRADAPNGEDCPQLQTVISGLDPAETYDIFAYNVSLTGSGFSLRFGMGGGDLTTYLSGSGVALQTISDLTLERVALGTVTAVSSVSIDIDDQPAGGTNRGFLKGFGINLKTTAVPIGDVGGTFVVGRGHAIGAVWAGPAAPAEFEPAGLSFSDPPHALASEPGRARLLFAGSGGSLSAPLDTRSDGLFAGLISSGAIHPAGSSLHFSVLLKIPAADISGQAFFALTGSSGDALQIGKIGGQAGHAARIPGGATARIPGGATAADASAPPDGSTRLLVGRIDFANGADSLSVWLDPRLELDADDPGQILPFATLAGELAFTGYRFGGDLDLEADEVRIGETWRSVLPLADSDLDGLPDAWELRFWPDLKVASGTEDSDGDRFDNRAEFEAGTHPLRPESRPAIGIEIEPDALSFNWYSAPGRFYRIEESAGLADWSGVPGTAAEGDGRILSALFGPPTGGRHFYRLATSPEPFPENP